MKVPFIKEESKKLLHNRLSFMFAPDEDVQKLSIMDFSTYSEQPVLAIGLADVVKDGIVYELKFVSDLTHEHFLQCACYVIALKLEKGILWNTRTNRMFEISIRDRERFFKTVLSTIQNHEAKQDDSMITSELSSKQNNSDSHTVSHSSKQTMKSTVSDDLKVFEKQSYFALIDTETNWNDDVMSIGLVIGSTADYLPVKKEYYVVFPYANMGGMYSNALYYKSGPRINQCKRQEALQSINEILVHYGVSTIFAYNAKFDYRHLPELSGFIWLDIMRIAAYKQFNSKLSEDDDYFSTGKLKRDYGVEPMYWLLSNNYEYREKHNAVFDAIDELRIMNLLGVSMRTYLENACINPNRIQFAISYLKKEKDNNNGISLNNKRNNQKAVATQTISSEEYDGCETIDSKEAALLLGVSVNQVYQLIRNGRIDAYKKKNKYCVLKQSVLMYQVQREHERRVMRWTAGIAAAVFLIMMIIMLFQTLN